MNQEQSYSNRGKIIAAAILGSSLLISAFLVSNSLDHVAQSISTKALPSFNLRSLRIDEPVTVHVDNSGEVPLKIETHETK
jgi:hypothetical protein